METRGSYKPSETARKRVKQDASSRPGKAATKTRKSKVSCPAEDGVINLVKRMENGKAVVDVELHPDWQCVLKDVGQNDTGFLIMWNLENVNATVNSINTGGGAAPPQPPGWLTLPTSPSQLQMDIINRMQNQTQAGPVVGNCLIAPNNLEQYGQLRDFAGHMCSDAFFSYHVGQPLGGLYYLADNKRRNTAERGAAYVPAGTVQVFA